MSAQAVRSQAVRSLALVIGAALLVAVPVEGAAAAKPFRFAAKRTVVAKKRTASRWRAAAPRPAFAALPAAPATPPAPDAPVVPAGGPAPAPAPAAPPAETPAAPLCDPSPWLGVIAEDVDGFRFRLTRTCVPAGTVLFQFRNRDLADHNLWAEGVAPATPKRRVVADTPGETLVQASADLSAGRWRLYCSFDGHEAMSRLVDVTPSG